MSKVQSSQNEDARLVGRISNGDKRALGEAYDRFGRLVYTFVLRMLRDPAEAENIVQEVFLTLLRQSGSYRPEEGSLRVWILTVARNAAIDRIRKQSREILSDHWDRPDESVRVDALDGIIADETAARLHRALDEIPVEQRTAVFMNFYDDASHQEIANLLDTPLGTVKTRIRLGLAKLRAAMGVADDE